MVVLGCFGRISTIFLPHFYHVGRRFWASMPKFVVLQFFTLFYAPALISLTSRILSSRSGCTTSDNLSIAEFIASPAKTRPIAKTTANHSTFVILKRNPASTTKIVIPQWIQAFCSWRTNRVSPLQALAKLPSSTPGSRARESRVHSGCALCQKPAATKSYPSVRCGPQSHIFPCLRTL